MATTADAVPVPSESSDPSTLSSPTTPNPSAPVPTQPPRPTSAPPAPVVAPLPFVLCSIAPREDEYQIMMKHVVGASVGIGMTDPIGGKGAVVKGDLQSTGQVAAWNKTCQESERVKEGDCLVGVGTKLESLTSVAGRTYKEVIDQVRTQIKEWEKDGVLILRFRRPPPRPVEEPHPPAVEKGEALAEKKETHAETKVKDPKEPEQKDGILNSAKKPPMLHSKRLPALDTDPVWGSDAASKLDAQLDRAAHAIEVATNAASAKFKKAIDGESTKKPKKDEKGVGLPKPEPVRDPDAEIFLTDGQQQYLEVLGMITSHSGKLAKLLQFVSKSQKQDVLFVCEVEQLLAREAQLTPQEIVTQTKKIMRVFLENGAPKEDGEPPITDEQAPPTEEPNGPVTVLQCLRPKVATRLRELYTQLQTDPVPEELKPRELIETLEAAKEDTRRTLCRDVLGNFADYLSGKTYNKDVESAEAFPFDFDDILVDARLYRAFLLFLMDAQRYQMLLFWKACYDLSLDTFVQSSVKDPATLRTLQDLYRKYIRGVSAPPSLQSYFPASFREQNITNDGTLPGALQATCKKIDRELRYDIWSMFLASPHYITLMGRQQGKGKSKNMNARNLMAFLKQQPVTQEMIVVPCKKIPVADPYMVAVVRKPTKSTPPTPNTSPPPSPSASPRNQALSPVSVASSISSVSPRPPPPAPAPAAPPVVELRPHRIFEYVIVLSAFDRAEHSSRLCNVKLLRRHPKGEHPDFAMPNPKHIAQLCFPFNEDVSGVCACPTNPHFNAAPPSGLDAWGCPSSAATHVAPEKRLFTFIMNDSSTGNKLYGAYLLIRAPPVERKAGEEQEEGHRSSNSLVAACVMSRIPLVQVLRDALWSLSSHTNHADWLTHPYELSLVPFLRMPSGSLLGPTKMTQTTCSDVPLKILLKHLHPNRVMLLLGALLLEKQILIACSDIAILGLVCECAISELLLPFIWNYLTIPILPFSMLHYLDCPTPFLMGIHTCYLPLARAKAVGKDTVIVNLDEDEITAVSELPRLPAVCASRLSDTLKSLYFENGLGLTARPADHICDPDLEFHRDLISMWAFMLTGWKDFCLYLPDQTDPSIIFDCPNFLNSRMQLLTATDSRFALRLDNKSIDELITFLGVFVRSGFFPLFIQQRTAFITHVSEAKSGDFDHMENYIKDGLDGIKSEMPVPVYTRPSFEMLQEALVLDPHPSFFEDDNDKSAKQSSLDVEEDVVIIKKPPTSRVDATATPNHPHITVETASNLTSITTSTMPETNAPKHPKEKSKFRSLFESKPKKLTPATLAPEKLAALATVTQTVQLTSSTSSAKQMFKKTFGALPSSWSAHHRSKSDKDSNGPSSENSRTSSRRSRNSRDYTEEPSRNAELGTDTATALYANRVVEASVSKNSEDSELRNPYEDSVNGSTWGSQASTNTRLAFSPELFIDPSSPPHADSGPITPNEQRRSPSRDTHSEDKTEMEGNGRSSLSGVKSGASSKNNQSSNGSEVGSDTEPSVLRITLNSRDPSSSTYDNQNHTLDVASRERSNPPEDVLTPDACAFSNNSHESENSDKPTSGIGGEEVYDRSQPRENASALESFYGSLDAGVGSVSTHHEPAEDKPLDSLGSEPSTEASSSSPEASGHIGFADTVSVLQMPRQEPSSETAPSDVVVHLQSDPAD